MERLEAFEEMLFDIEKDDEYDAMQMEHLKTAGQENSAAYRQYQGSRLLYKLMLEKYREYGLTE